MNKITWKQLYNTVILNKGLLDDAATKYWAAVDSHWKDNGRKKIWEFSPFECITSSGVNAHDFIDDKSLIEVFSWYINNDLARSTKYFSMHIINDYKVQNKLFRHDKIESLNDVIIWDDRFYRDRNAVALGKEISEDLNYKPNIDFIGSINNHMKINFINDVLPEGFSDWVSKKTKKKLNFPPAINNKMDFAIWKKVATSKKMNNSHLKDCFLSVSRSSDWHIECWNALADSKNSYVAINKKYFGQKFISDLNATIKNKKIHPKLTIAGANNLVERWNGINYTSGQEYSFDSQIVISFIENTDISKLEKSPAEFLDLLISKKIIDFISFGDDDSLFSRNNFINHIKKKWNIAS